VLYTTEFPGTALLAHIIHQVAFFLTLFLEPEHVSSVLRRGFFERWLSKSVPSWQKKS